MASYKVIDADQLDADLSVVADAIRAKGETTEVLSFPEGFATALASITGGLPEQITKLNAGTFTLTADQTSDMPIEHGLGVTPSGYIILAQGMFNADTPNYLFGQFFGKKTHVAEGETYAGVGNSYHITTSGAVSAATLRTTNLSDRMDESRILIRVLANHKLKARHIYRWIAFQLKDW